MNSGPDQNGTGEYCEGRKYDQYVSSERSEIFTGRSPVCLRTFRLKEIEVWGLCTVSTKAFVEN